MVIQALEVTVLSANGLRDLKIFNTMEPYATVTLFGGDEQRTSVDKKGGTNPHWAYRVAFPVDEATARAGHLYLNFKIWTKKKYGRDDRDVARGRVQVRELLEKQRDGNPEAISHKVELQPQGELEFRFYFSEALPTPRAAYQELPERIRERGLMRMLLCAGQIASTIVDVAVE